MRKKVAILGYLFKKIKIKLMLRIGKKWEKWWPREDLNLRPLPCQGSALPAELRDHQIGVYCSKLKLNLF